MNQPLTFLGIPGSLRQHSFNLGLLTAAQELAPEYINIEIFRLNDIPMFNADVEKQAVPETVQAFRAAVGRADALIFATPEYNYSITGAMKNAIDWASRRYADSPPPINDKPTGIMGAGGRSGTLRAQLHLRQILQHNNLHVLNSPTVQVAQARTHFDENGRLTTPDLRDRIARLLDALYNWTLLFKSGQH